MHFTNDVSPHAYITKTVQQHNVALNALAACRDLLIDLTGERFDQPMPLPHLMSIRDVVDRAIETHQQKTSGPVDVDPLMERMTVAALTTIKTDAYAVEHVAKIAVAYASAVVVRLRGWGEKMQALERLVSAATRTVAAYKADWDSEDYDQALQEGVSDIEEALAGVKGGAA